MNTQSPGPTTETSAISPPGAGQRLRALLQRGPAALLEPYVHGLEPDERRQARLVAGLLLITSLALLIRTYVAKENRVEFLLIFFISSFAYLLCRMGRYRLAAWAAVLALCAPSFMRALTLPNQNSADELFTRMAWLAFAIVLSGLILPTWGTVLITALNVAAIIALAWLIQGLEPSATATSVAFVVVLGLLVISVMRQRDFLENDRREQELGRERRLNEVAHAISSALDLDIVLETVVRLSVELTQADAGMLSLTSEDGEQLEKVHAYNLYEKPVQSRPPKGSGLAWEVILTRKPLLLDDYRQHPRHLTRLDQGKVRAYLGVPILSGEACLGTLAVASGPNSHTFNRRDLELMQAVARQAGIAIQNARLYAALESELSERRRIEDELRQRDEILEAVASAAGQFMQSQNWQLYIQTVLAELGQITHSSHAYIYRNHPGLDGEMLTSQLYQWTAPGTQATLGHPLFNNVPLQGPGLERWQQAMLRGEPYYGSRSTFLPGEERYLAPLGAQSVLEMPICLQYAPDRDLDQPSMEWWGVIGFDDYEQERQWSVAEVDAIKIAASMVSAAIQRQRADEAVREREDIYRRAISTADAVPYYQEYYPNRYVFMGDGIEKITGFKAADATPELFDSRVVMAVPLDEAQGRTVEEATQMARNGELANWRCDYLIRARDDSLRWIADTGIELIGADGKSHGSIGIMQDITERKQAEEAAWQAQQELERRVQERTAELEAANREMESFAYSVSHDLRAPLRAIDGYSRILLEDHLEHLNEDGQACLANVRSAAQKMNQLINDLLQLSRVTRAEMKAVPVDLSALAEEFCQGCRQQEPERSVNVTIQPGLLVTGDTNLLRIALSNLMDNAWKFTRRTPAAEITVGCLPPGVHPWDDIASVPGEEPCIFFVRDNGAGFDMQYQAKLFQAFQRLHSPTEFEGVGIGLATVQRIIRRHNGQVWAEGQVGRGATFYFTIGPVDEQAPS